MSGTLFFSELKFSDYSRTNFPLFAGARVLDTHCSSPDCTWSSPDLALAVIGLVPGLVLAVPGGGGVGECPHFQLGPALNDGRVEVA